VFFGGFLLLQGVISRLGWMAGVPWLRLDAAGPLDVVWWLRHGGMCLLGGAAFGYIFSKMLRFPNTPEDGSAA
jgi:hypothetical protein